MLVCILPCVFLALEHPDDVEFAPGALDLDDAALHHALRADVQQADPFRVHFPALFAAARTSLAVGDAHPTLPRLPHNRAGRDRTSLGLWAILLGSALPTVLRRRIL